MKYPLRWLACAVLATAPLAAHAQTASTYVAPKLVERGTNVAPVAGAGDVVVQVFVKKDGTFTVTKVVKTSNPADNPAALEIAKSSKYKPATRDGKPQDGYYDFNVSFAGNTAAIGSGPLAAATTAIHAGKYDQAKSQLQTYLQTHPDDTQANTLLGVADTFGGDPAGAAAAFDKAGTIPDEYKELARQSYEKTASTDIGDKRYSDAVAAAGHALDIAPQSVNAYYLRASANMNMQNYTAAIGDLQKARSIASGAKVDPQTANTLTYTLAVAQVNAGQFGEAAGTGKDLYRSDPAHSAQLDKFAYVAAMDAAIALANSGKNADAVSRLESGAASFPNDAGALLSEAAYIMATDKKPDWDKVRAEAEKALAADPKAGRANFVLGIAAAQKNDTKTALDYMNKAKASPAYGSDPALAKQIDDALNKLNSPGKS